MTLQLYPFQQESVDKLEKVPAVLIGDDMGLGKTVQAIALDKRKREMYGPTFRRSGKPLTLVVAPLSVLGVWRSHFKEWQPTLEVLQLNPKDRPGFIRSFKEGKADVYLCHWESLRLMPELQDIQWFHVIADEAHRAKNRKSQQTMALKKIHTSHKAALSGTPADNRPDDFWSILNWLYSRTWSSYWRFFNYHVIVKHHNEIGSCGCPRTHKRPYKEIIGCEHVDELMDQIRPYYVRRLKEEVIKDLPDKYYSTIEVDLTPLQQRSYDDMRKTMLAWVGRHEDEPVAAPVVIAQLTRLQQFACAYAKVDTNTNKLALTDPSSKLDAVEELILDNPNDQFVVFAQSKQVVNLLANRLWKHKVPTSVLTGDVPHGDRAGLISDFQSERTRVFTGTIAAGGEGITLTSASTVVFVDRAWSPSKNRQAEDRLHRIGQKNSVQVIDIVARGTIDRGRNQQIAMKWDHIRQILGDVDGR